MSAIEKCIREAVEKGGYEPWFNLLRVEKEIGFKEAFWRMYSGIFFDSAFWQALGKARGWDDLRDGIKEARIDYLDYANGTIFGWKSVWHRFIDHLAEGRDAEEFFASL